MATKRSRNNSSTTQEEERNKPHNVVIPYVAGVSEKLRNWFTLRTKFPDTTLTMLLMQ